MEVKITTVNELGLIVRCVRKKSMLRIDDFASMAGVSKTFASELEHGKPTLQIDRVLKVLDDLGIKLVATVPREAQQQYLDLKAKGGLKPLARRRKQSVILG